MLAFRDRLQVLSATILVLATSTSAIAQKKYDPGASDTEIRIGNIV
jgi:branched-chain amino acid transport system substrate-binding protein